MSHILQVLVIRLDLSLFMYRILFEIAFFLGVFVFGSQLRSASFPFTPGKSFDL